DGEEIILCIETAGSCNWCCVEEHSSCNGYMCADLCGRLAMICSIPSKEECAVLFTGHAVRECLK
ncbi:hypothetical protein MTO96_021936, partial [Rhipicephalus appendiculatus]